MQGLKRQRLDESFSGSEGSFVRSKPQGILSQNRCETKLGEPSTEFPVVPPTVVEQQTVSQINAAPSSVGCESKLLVSDSCKSLQSNGQALLSQESLVAEFFSKIGNEAVMSEFEQQRHIEELTRYAELVANLLADKK